MRITWHPEAEDELIKAAKFYNQRVAGLGVDFLDAVDSAVRHITRDPKLFPLLKSGIQRCRVTRFPYCLYFRCLPDAIRILVVMHHNRQPDYWQSRQ
jgi:toxin ParE1/3/4